MNRPIACDVITWNQFYELCRKLVTELLEAGFYPDLIVAIGRGGYIPARVLADFLGVMQLNSMRIEHYQGSHKEPKALVKDPLVSEMQAQRILVVDDVSDTGDTFELALRHIKRHASSAQIRTAAVHYKVVSNYEPDFYAQQITQWRWITYPWAVIEDLCVFIKSMKPRPKSLKGITEKLIQDHGIRVSRQTLQEAMRTLEHQLW
jgi:hypoxanthine phosphoribosyltransferase